MKVSKKTAIIAVDLQKSLTMPGGNNYYETATEMMDRVAENLNKMREKGALIIYIWTKTQLSSGLTCAAPAINPDLEGRVLSKKTDEMLELDDRLRVVPEKDLVICKHTYSAFWGTPLLEALEQNGIENVVVCGIKTNICCRQTVVDSASHGYKTYIIRDMTSTNNEEIKAYHLAEMNKYFAKVLDSAEVLERLDSGTF